MTKTISSKELRQNFPRIKNQVQKGCHFIVYYRSKPLFDITPHTAQTVAGGKKPTWADFRKLISHSKDRKSFDAVEIIRKDRGHETISH